MKKTKFYSKNLRQTKSSIKKLTCPDRPLSSKKENLHSKMTRIVSKIAFLICTVCRVREETVLFRIVPKYSRNYFNNT